MLSFNMTYVVVGAAAVALIIVVLVLVVVRSRGRKAQVASGLDAGPEWAPVADEAVLGVGETSVVDAAIASEEPMAETTPELAPAAAIGPGALPPGTASPPDHPAAALVQPAAPPDLRPGIDPAVTLVTSLIQHSGELDPEELRRLELYRPERIVAAVEALTPRMTGRSNESKRSRLARIRQYADSLTAEPIGEPVPTDVVVAPDPGPVRPPEAWGSDIGGARLTLDPELSLLDEQPEPTAEDAPTVEVAPAAEEPDDTDKRMAIDTLARLATPEALSRLQRYLDDPDPEIQLYALSAAERLLGPE